MPWAVIVAAALKGAAAADQKGNDESAQIAAGASQKPTPAPAPSNASMADAIPKQMPVPMPAPVPPPQTATPTGGLLNPVMPPQVNAMAGQAEMLPRDLHAQVAAAAADAGGSFWDRLQKNKGFQGLMGGIAGATGNF
jgi:hypothetical protein